MNWYPNVIKNIVKAQTHISGLCLVEFHFWKQKEARIRSFPWLFCSRTKQDTAPGTEMYRKWRTPYNNSKCCRVGALPFPRYSSVSLKELSPIKDKFYNAMQPSDVLYFCSHFLHSSGVSLTSARYCSENPSSPICCTEWKGNPLGSEDVTQCDPHLSL